MSERLNKGLVDSSGKALKRTMAQCSQFADSVEPALSRVIFSWKSKHEKASARKLHCGELCAQEMLSFKGDPYVLATPGL